MSEKRFTMKYSFEDEEYVFYEDGIPLTPSQTVNNLNEQQDQVSKLQANVEYLIDSKKELIEKIGEQQATISALKEENEQLKQEVFVYKKKVFQEQVRRCTL